MLLLTVVAILLHYNLRFGCRQVCGLGSDWVCGNDNYDI